VDTEFSPGDIVQILSIETKEKFRVGMRYCIILDYESKIVTDYETKKEKLVDGYHVLVGSKVEWHNVIAIRRPIY
jgi:hypothetical protein